MLSLLLGCQTPDTFHPDRTGHTPTDPTTGTHTDLGQPSLPAVTATQASPQLPTVTRGALTFDLKIPRNLLVISLDTTRRDYVGRFSGSTDTPNLDAFLEESVVLENHRSCSNWTAWSMTCVLSGRNPMENGFAPWTWFDPVPDYPTDRYETLPMDLGAQGWDTVLVTANDVFSSGPSGPGITRGFAREVPVAWQPAADVAAAGLDEASHELDQRAPWYLHVHFIDPHGDYCPPSGWYDISSYQNLDISADDVCQGSYDDAPDFWDESNQWQREYVDELQELYRGELRYWDSEFGTFLSDLDAMGALDDTLVVFVTDHGQQFYERDPEGYGDHGHGIYLGSEENRSTAAFWAKNLHPGTWEGPTIHQDLTETLYELYNVQPTTPTDGTFVGTAPDDRVLRGENYWFNQPVVLSVVKSGHQLVYDWLGGKHFYKLEDDPTGLTDVYDASDPDVIALWSDMRQWVKEVQQDWSFMKAPPDEGP